MKLEIIVIIQENIGGVAHNVCNLKYSVPKKIPIAFHYGSNYDYHFIIKAEESEKQFTCSRKSFEKYITFTVPIEKEVTRIDKNGEEITKNISYRFQFIDSARLLSNLVNSFSERIHEIKCKHGHDDKNLETSRIKYKHCDSFLEYTNFEDDLIECKCLSCNKNYQQKFDENLKKQKFNTYKFSNYDNNKLIFLL